MPIGHQDSGATAGVKFVTSTVSNTVGGLVNTVGGIAGAAGRGICETIEGATSSAGKSVGTAIVDGATSLENGTHRAAGVLKVEGQGN
jgi:phage-related protein